MVWKFLKNQVYNSVVYVSGVIYLPGPFHRTSFRRHIDASDARRGPGMATGARCSGSLPEQGSLQEHRSFQVEELLCNIVQFRHLPILPLATDAVFPTDRVATSLQWNRGRSYTPYRVPCAALQ